MASSALAFRITTYLLQAIYSHWWTFSAKGDEHQRNSVSASFSFKGTNRPEADNILYPTVVGFVIKGYLPSNCLLLPSALVSNILVRFSSERSCLLAIRLITGHSVFTILYAHYIS